jgi:hypothetical protein
MVITPTEITVSRVRKEILDQALPMTLLGSAEGKVFTLRS